MQTRHWPTTLFVKYFDVTYVTSSRRVYYKCSRLKLLGNILCKRRRTDSLQHSRDLPQQLDMHWSLGIASLEKAPLLRQASSRLNLVSHARHSSAQGIVTDASASSFFICVTATLSSELDCRKLASSSLVS